MRPLGIFLPPYRLLLPDVWLAPCCLAGPLLFVQACPVPSGHGQLIPHKNGIHRYFSTPCGDSERQW